VCELAGIDITAIGRWLVNDQITDTVLEDGSGVLLDLEGRQVLSLNDSGMWLVQHLRAGELGFDVLIDGLMACYAVPREVAVGDVVRFLRDLEALLPEVML